MRSAALALAGLLAAAPAAVPAQVPGTTVEAAPVTAPDSALRPEARPVPDAPGRPLPRPADVAVPEDLVPGMPVFPPGQPLVPGTPTGPAGTPADPNDADPAPLNDAFEAPAGGSVPAGPPLGEAFPVGPGDGAAPAATDAAGADETAGAENVVGASPVDAPMGSADAAPTASDDPAAEPSAEPSQAGTVDEEDAGEPSRPPGATSQALPTTASPVDTAPADADAGQPDGAAPPFTEATHGASELRTTGEASLSLPDAGAPADTGTAGDALTELTTDATDEPPTDADAAPETARDAVTAPTIAAPEEPAADADAAAETAVEAGAVPTAEAPVGPAADATPEPTAATAADAAPNSAADAATGPTSGVAADTRTEPGAASSADAVPEAPAAEPASPSPATTADDLAVPGVLALEISTNPEDRNDLRSEAFMDDPPPPPVYSDAWDGDLPPARPQSETAGRGTGLSPPLRPDNRPDAMPGEPAAVQGPGRPASRPELRPGRSAEIGPVPAAGPDLPPAVAGGAPAFPDFSPFAVALALRPPERPAAVAEAARRVAAERARGQICGTPEIQGEVLGRVDGSGSCGIEQAVKVRSVAGIRLSTAATMDCQTAQALNRWVRQVAIPQVGTEGGGLATLRVAADYSCRGRNNVPGARLSEHAFGRAIDIGGFVLRNGGEFSVLNGWGTRSHGGRLRGMHDGACGIFGTVLGPEANAQHRDHFHFDTARYRSGSYCR